MTTYVKQCSFGSVDVFCVQEFCRYSMTSLCFKINGNVKVSKDNKIVIATKTDIHLRLNLDQNKLKFKFFNSYFWANGNLHGLYRPTREFFLMQCV